MKSFALHKYLAEMLGTFMLSFGVGLSIAHPSAIPTVVVAGLILGIVVYTMGPISGAHINPAVTMGLWSTRQISATEALRYVIAQFLGACITILLLRNIVSLPQIEATNALSTILCEVIGTFVLAFGVAAVSNGKVHQAASGLVVGGSLSIGIFLTSGGSLGVLNPAVALAIHAFSLTYFLAPVLGGILGAQAYRWLMKR